jgi:hypothetical protein
MSDIVETSYKYGYQDGYLAALDYLEMTIKTDYIFPTVDPYLRVNSNDANYNDDIKNILYLINVLRWQERNNGGVKNYE